MVKFVDYRGQSGHFDYMLTNDEHKADVIIVRNNFFFKSTLLRFLFFLHYSRINVHINLPYKSIWYKFLAPPPTNDIYCFIITVSIISSYGEHFVYFLRSYYNCKIVLVLGDKVTTYGKGLDLVKLKGVVDMICTFNKIDATKFNIRVHPHIMFNLNLKNLKPLKDRGTDVIFIGQEKGRGLLISTIYKKCIDYGLKCEFYIIGRNNIGELPGVIECRWIPYGELFDKIKNAKCILNLLQPDSLGITFRDIEAYNLGSFLLTNNPSEELNDILHEDQIIKIDDFDQSMADLIKNKEESFTPRKISNSLDYFYNWILNEVGMCE